ncbi:MAG: sugar-transfer associated ATP-grasp domain-containing protein, partial [Legionella sp.]|nr:sugar-transfer associated ATP-grasp domain-containing protein [Legionella sp.]
VQPFGKDAESNVNNVLMAPIDPESGVLLDGVFVNSTDEKFSCVPWNGAPLLGRFVPEFKQAVQMVLDGSTLFPDVPLLGWDVILSDQGPVILESNIGVSLSRSQLWHYETGVESPLMPTLLEWTK